MQKSWQFLDNSNAPLNFDSAIITFAMGRLPYPPKHSNSCGEMSPVGFVARHTCCSKQHFFDHVHIIRQIYGTFDVAVQGDSSILSVQESSTVETWGYDHIAV